jgi:prolipoprotein diacylglyceryltransferase
VPIAAIAFDFDPLFRLAETLVVRWQTIALAIVIAAALITVGVIARRASLRADDLLFIAVGIVPGAVIGGRLGFALLHLDYYAADPGAILDPAGGGMELGLAVAGGLLTAAYVARLLDAAIGPWSQIAVLPLLFALGAGKLTMVLGGAGQGQPSELAWATAYLGPGPWSSLAPGLPSHPSQAYEGIATLVVLLAFVLVLAGTGRGSRLADGRGLCIGLGTWALVRALVGLTWRDPAVVGPFNAGSMIALALAIGFLTTALALTVRARNEIAAPTGLDPAPAGPGPDLAVPEESPRP